MEKKCKACGMQKPIVARGLCNACYCKHRNTNQLNNFGKVRPDNSIKKICERCGKLRKIYARERCRACYERTTVINKMINGKRITLRIPFGDKLKASKYFDEKKKELLEDLKSNPRKWLGEKEDVTNQTQM